MCVAQAKHMRHVTRIGTPINDSKLDRKPSCWCSLRTRNVCVFTLSEFAISYVGTLN